MSDSVLDRIRQNRQRVTVPLRDDTLITQVQRPEPLAELAVELAAEPALAATVVTAGTELVEPVVEPVVEAVVEAALTAPAIAPSVAPAIAPSVAPAAITPDTLAELRAELATIPDTNRHSAIVLDKELDQNLTRYCKDNRITIEVFLEAAWMQAVANPAALAEILTAAKRRYADRKRAGKLRRLITMLEGQS